MGDIKLSDIIIAILVIMMQQKAYEKIARKQATKIDAEWEAMNGGT